MSRLWMISLILVCMACQSGVIPCPKIKPVRAKRSNAFKRMTDQSTNNVSASASESEESTTTSKRSRGSDTRVISNVSVEEWDCPRPGNKKYMPRKVKENIKKNFQKINASQKEKSDSIAAVQKKR